MASLIILMFSFFLFSSALGMSIITSDEETQSETEAMAMYESWLVKHGKMYNALGEKEKRFTIFKDNLRFIDDHNSVDRPYKLGMNRFADLTNEEYRSKFVNGRLSQGSKSVSRSASDRYAVQAGDDLPENVDWREKGAVAPIKDQGQCGSCWAFSTVAAVEAVNKIVTGDLIVLSEQELVDCDKEYNQGCNGGFIDYALKFIINNGGLDTEEDYPYKGHDATCDKKQKNAHVVSIDSYEHVQKNDEQALKKAVAGQPISVSIDAGGRIFQHYESGIFTGLCGTDLDHAVVVVGYGSEDGKDYWIVRNSWGLDWGESGYIRVERNLAYTTKGKCGIAIEPFYPIKNSPKPNMTPPAPAKPSTVCDKYFSCEAGSTCCCVYEYQNMCSAWGCCPMESATCCDDQFSCCPSDYPVCDLAAGTCLVKEDNPLGIPAMRRGDARLSWLGLDGSRRISCA